MVVRTNCATRTTGACALRPSREDHHRSVCADHPRPALNASAVFPLARHAATRFFQIAEVPDIKRAIFGQPTAAVKNGGRAPVTKLPLERINEAFDLMHAGASIRTVVEF